jgi:orotate phosphoribosyltransferase
MTGPELREQLLWAGFTAGETTYHGGQPANHKLNLDFEHIADAGLLDKIVDRAAELTRDWRPDFVVGVPDGASKLAIQLAVALPAYSVVLRKDGHHFRYSDSHDAENVQRSRRGVIVEDVANRRGSIAQILEMTSLGSKIVGAVCIWDRGDEKDPSRQWLSIPIRSIIKEYIPPMLDEKSELWKYAKH